jgi:hypothetical protein
LLQIHYYYNLKQKNQYNEYSQDKICEQIGDLHKYHEILDSPYGEVPDKYVPELITFCTTIDMFFHLNQKHFIHDLGQKVVDNEDIPFTHYDLSEMYKCPQDMTIRYRKSIERMSWLAARQSGKTTTVATEITKKHVIAMQKRISKICAYYAWHL